MSIRGIDGGHGPLGPAAAGAQHTVKAGDTLEGIAKQHGASVEDLVRSNPQLKSTAGITPGQVLLLPAVQKQVLAQQTVAGDKLESSLKPSIFDKAGLAQASGQGAGDPVLVKLSPRDLHTDEKGQLVVKNDQLAASFKHAMVAGKGIIQNLPGEAASLNFTRLNPATVQFYQEFLQRQAQGTTGSAGEGQVQGNARSGAGAGAALETKAFGDPHLSVSPGEAKMEAFRLNVPNHAAGGEHQDKTSPLSSGPTAHSSGEAKLWDVFRPTMGSSEDVKLENRRGDLALDGSSKYPAGQAAGEKVAFLPISPGEVRSIDVAERVKLDPGEVQVVGPETMKNQAGAVGPESPAAMKLSPEHFEFNGEGHLVIKNDQLAEMLKATLGAAAPGENVSFGVTAARQE